MSEEDGVEEGEGIEVEGWEGVQEPGKDKEEKDEDMEEKVAQHELVSLSLPHVQTLVQPLHLLLHHICPHLILSSPSYFLFFLKGSFTIFIGPRCPWGPIYGSGSL